MYVTKRNQIWQAYWCRIAYWCTTDARLTAMWRWLAAQKTVAESPRTAAGEGARIGDCRPVHRPRIRGVLGSSAATSGLASSLLPRVKGEGVPTFDTGAYWSATAQVRHRNSPTGNAPPPQR